MSSFPFEFVLPNATGDVPTYIKALRVVRLVRLVKLLRFFKMLRLLNRLFKTLMSRQMASMFKILRILCLMALSAHFCACGFYGAGLYTMSKRDRYDTNWLVAQELAVYDDEVGSSYIFMRSIFHRYSVSLVCLCMYV